MVAQQRSEGDIELLEGLGEAEGELAEQAQQASVVKFVNELLIESLNQNASDVHLEPQESGLMIRFRVDGMLRVQPVPPELNYFQSAIISRLKIMSRLNIAEKRLPQDGRIKLRVQGREIDVRVSIIPMMHGEGIVLRILDKGRMVFNLKNVGLTPDMSKTFRELIDLPHGIILVTGPTGSGKTTTLYSALNEIKDPTIKIITVEDPVEYHMNGISQIQVHSKIGLTFAAGLRSILRHDPDVILIGEIRDGETANSAIQSSLTGHLVFSTLHTNDAAGAFTRLADMGVEPYLVASTVEGVMAQRLVRILCPHCKTPYRPTDNDVPPDFPRPLPEKIYRPVGCRQCRDTGYAGRQGIFELMRTDEGIRQLCVERASATQIFHYAREHGLTTLRQDGWNRVLAGITSVEDVTRITKPDYV
jgi:type II secretory ATPase GspE/PulE/Tfp pilus assembly ATPase PilB-like protein